MRRSDVRDSRALLLVAALVGAVISHAWFSRGTSRTDRARVVPLRGGLTSTVDITDDGRLDPAMSVVAEPSLPAVRDGIPVRPPVDTRGEVGSAFVLSLDVLRLQQPGAFVIAPSASAERVAQRAEERAEDLGDFFWRVSAARARQLGVPPWELREFQLLASTSDAPGLYVTVAGEQSWPSASVPASIRWFEQAGVPPGDRLSLAQTLRAFDERRRALLAEAMDLVLAGVRDRSPVVPATTVAVVAGRLFLREHGEADGVSARLQFRLSEVGARVQDVLR
ncbi:MAG: hypothetical protein IT460_00470 [Planctomycetes bacterium]|nr:hypothetical protein [Planctomycetota bacterium]